MPRMAGFQESFTPRRPETLNPIQLLWQALQADPTGASGMANPVAGPALLGALFKNPQLARLFALATQLERGGATRSGQGAGLGWLSAAAGVSDEGLSIMDRAFRQLVNPTFMRNIASAEKGQTFAKNILPFSGAAHKLPTQALPEEQLAAALLLQHFMGVAQ